MEVEPEWNYLVPGIPIETIDPAIKTEDAKREVNRFLGWDIFNLRRKLEKRCLRAEENDWIMDEYVDGMISFVDNIKILHVEAIMDVDNH